MKRSNVAKKSATEFKYSRLHFECSAIPRRIKTSTFSAVKMTKMHYHDNKKELILIQTASFFTSNSVLRLL